MKSRSTALALSAVALVVAACGSGSVGQGSEGDRLSVVVTTTIWGDIVSNVTGDAADVEVLFPIGADAHDYQLSSAQVAAVQEADLVVINGLGLEEGILDVIESLEVDGANILEVAPLLDPIEFGEGGHDHDGEHHEDEDEAEEDEHHEDGDSAEEDEHPDEEDGHEHEGLDPHVWMDPLRVADAVGLIATELAAIDSTTNWAANADAYATTLRTLDEQVVTTLDAIPEAGRVMVTNHEAFGYFVDRYEFEVLGVVIPGGTTLSDPSSAELAGLVDVMIDEGVNVIFAETVEPTTLADAVASEVGEDVEVVELFTESLGGPGSGGETYVEMLRTNADLIAEALS